MDVANILSHLMDGGIDTMLLLVLVLIDTVLGTSQSIKNGKSVLSRVFLSGLFRNVILCFVPYLISLIGNFKNSNDMIIFGTLPAVYSILFAYAILESIMANLNILGVKLPEKLIKLLSDEIESKQEKNLPSEKGSDKSEHQSEDEPKSGS